MVERAAAAAVLSRRYERASSSGSGIARRRRRGRRARPFALFCARVRAGEGLLHPLGLGGPSTMAGLRTFSYRPKTLYHALCCCAAPSGQAQQTFGSGHDDLS